MEGRWKKKDFALEQHAWQLLKDQPRWLEQCKKVPSKRTKLNENWNYSLSSNPETLIDIFESDTPTPLAHPMGQKAAKRKIKVKGASSSTSIVDLSAIEKEIKERNIIQKQIIEVVEYDNFVKI